MEKNNKDKKISLEIIRFVITGLICALLDFATSYIVTVLLKKTDMNDTLIVALSTLIGFTISVIANYLLSTLWVFKNVKDKNKAKKPLFIVVFIVLSAIGWGLSFGTMELCRLACNAWFKVDINSVKLEFAALGTAVFWLFGVSFVLKTLVGMVWNYLTRKFILYKAPKEEKTNEPIEEEKIEENDQ